MTGSSSLWLHAKSIVNQSIDDDSTASKASKKRKSLCTFEEKNASYARFSGSSPIQAFDMGEICP